MACPISTKDSKRVILSKDVPFGGANNVPLNFEKKLNKTEILAPMHSTFKRERSFVRGLQPRGYIAECFRLFRVVVKGPKRWFLLIGFSIPLSPNFCLWEILVYIHNAICTARPIWTKDGQNASVQGCAFCGSQRCSLN